MSINVLIIGFDGKQFFPYKEFLLAQQAVLIESKSIVEGIYHLARRTFDLVILDVDDITDNSLAMLTRLKKATAKPVICFSNHMSETDRINTLNAGAAESLLNSEPLPEVKKLLGRFCQKKHYMPLLGGHQLLKVNDLSLCLNRREVKSQNTNLVTTGLEFELLFLLMSNVGQIVERRSIIECLFNNSSKSADKSLNMHISNIRKKLALLSSKSEIKTVRGSGYVLL